MLTQVTAFLIDRADFEVSPPAETPFGSPPTPTAQAGIWVIGAPLETRFAPPSSRAVARGLSYGSKDEIVILKSAFPSIRMRPISFSLCRFRQIALLSHLQVLRSREEPALRHERRRDGEPLTLEPTSTGPKRGKSIPLFGFPPISPSFME